MSTPSKNMNSQYASVTPVTCKTSNNLQIPSRKLWAIETVAAGSNNESWNKYRNSRKVDKWDTIESPNFVDFSNLPETSDSFFDKPMVIVSTPKPNAENEKTTEDGNDPLITSLNQFSLSGIKSDDAEVTVISIQQKDGKEQYEVHDASINTTIKDKNPTPRPLNIAGKPFTFDLRKKLNLEHKPEYATKVTEERKKLKAFRANPVPKLIKEPTAGTSNSNNNNDQNNNNSDGINPSNKQAKKKIEVWKKPPFVPSLSRKNLEKPKFLPLHSTIRAEERKRFDDALKEKEKQREEIRQMELIAKKKQEEEEIARLRKQTVHKAQPIRKYKLNLPKIEKRPLTDPISPLTLKRRRRA